MNPIRQFGWNTTNGQGVNDVCRERLHCSAGGFVPPALVCVDPLQNSVFLYVEHSAKMLKSTE